MKCKNLGRSGLSVSRICPDTMNFEAPYTELFPPAGQSPQYYAW